jgi:glutaredoxin
MDMAWRGAGTGLLLATAALLTAPASGEIYRYKDAEGRTHFTDRPPDRKNAELLALRINTYAGEPVVREYSSALKSLGGRVTLYGTAWCGVCKLAKNWMRANNVAFTEFDIETNAAAQRQYLAMGGGGVPVIVVGGRAMQGFSPAQMLQRR